MVHSWLFLTLFLLCIHFTTAEPGVSDSIVIPLVYSPVEIVVHTGANLFISIEIQNNTSDSDYLAKRFDSIPSSTPLSIEVISKDTSLVTVSYINITVAGLLDSIGNNESIHGFILHGDFLGRSEVEIRIIHENPRIEFVPSTIPVAVIRAESGELKTLIFIIVITILSLVNTFMMGAQLDPQIILAVLKKPLGPGIGFSCQFILMPLLSFGWCFAFFSGNTGLQLGLFAMGCSPGGGASNFWTIMMDGNIDLSVTMTFISNLAALIMMPFWLFTLGRVIFGGKVSIPFFNILGGIATLVLPAGLGLLFRMKYPEKAKKLKRVIKFTTLTILLFVYTYGIYANWYIWRLFTWRTILAGMLLPWSAFILSFSVCWLLRQSGKDCRTIAIETGIQNGGVAIILLQFSLPAPEKDLAIVPPVCVLIFTAIPLWFILLYRTIKKRCFSKENSEKTGSLGLSKNIISTISNRISKSDTATTDLSSTGSYINNAADLKDNVL